MIKCMGCGVEKDMDVLEIYPYPEDSRLCEDPLPSLFVLEVQPEVSGEWKVAITCHECFKKLDPDMWISENCWIKLNPVVPFSKLPLNNMPMDTDEERAIKWNPASYEN